MNYKIEGAIKRNRKNFRTKKWRREKRGFMPGEFLVQRNLSYE